VWEDHFLLGMSPGEFRKSSSWPHDFLFDFVGGGDTLDGFEIFRGGHYKAIQVEVGDFGPSRLRGVS